MDNEIELKFLLQPDTPIAILPLLESFAQTVTQQPTRVLDNTYYDTPTRTLRQHDIGLRTRSNGERMEQTIKLKGNVVGGLHQRPEYNLPITRTRPDLTAFEPSIWPKDVDVAALNSDIEAVFTTRFERQTWLVTTDAGTVLEVVWDQGEVLAGDKTCPIFELEVELMKGDLMDVFAFAEHLSQNLPVRLGFMSKAERGYRLAEDMPLKAKKRIGYVKQQKDATQEQALIACVSFGIRFVQHHEQCYFNKPSLKTLKRMTDGINLIRHALWLFAPIVSKQSTEQLRKELKWFLREFAWIETALQVKTFTSKKHAYHKRLHTETELMQCLEGQLAEQPDQSAIQAVFWGKRYNHMLLTLTRWLQEKAWRSDWQDAQHALYGESVKRVAKVLFAEDWDEMQHLLPVGAQNIDFAAQRQKLSRNLLSGCCLGGLFDEKAREDFRLPWLDITYGIDELLALNYLESLCGFEHAGDEQLKKWLLKRKACLVDAMEQSRQVALKAEPYWE